MVTSLSPLFAFLLGDPFSLLAAAGAAVSIPVIIHLLNRRRFRVVTWAAMRFLLLAEKKNSRRMRIEQLLLLAARVLLVCLLVLALASVRNNGDDWTWWQYFFPSTATANAASASRRTHKIIVLDGSFSMGLKVANPNGEGNTTCFELARVKAQEIVDKSSGGDGFSIVLMAAPPKRIVPGLTDVDVKKVKTEIQSIRLPHGNADLAATLNTVESLLRESPAKFHDREVYFLTDLQRSTWVNPQPANLNAMLQKIQAKARTILVDVGKDRVSNLAITNVMLGTPIAMTNTFTPIIATVNSYSQGEGAREQVRAQLLVGKAPAVAGDPAFEMRMAHEQTVSINPGQNTITFPFKFLKAGDYVVQVKLENDSLELDDIRSAVVTAKDSVPVMVVNGKPDAVEVYDRASEWLVDALNPFMKDPERKVPIPANVPARPKVFKPKDFSDPWAGDLTPFDCVFFCDIRSFEPEEVRRIETHLRLGGGVVFFLGDKVDIADYNKQLFRDGKGILPARLIGKQEAPEKHFFHFTVDDKAYKEPPLDAFSDDKDRATLLTVRFREYLRAELSPRGGPRKILSYMPQAVGEDKKPKVDRLPLGDPAVIEWQPPVSEAERRKKEESGLIVPSRFRGRVILFTSTANMEWNTWPASPSYLPFMQELLRHAVAGKLREQCSNVGELVEDYLPNTAGDQNVVMHTPEGRTESFKTTAHHENSILRWTDTEISGIYRAVVAKQPKERLFAINVPAAMDTQQATESDLTRTTPDELQSTYKEWKFQIVKELGQVVHVETTDNGEVVNKPDLRPMGMIIARWLLLAMLVLIFAEVVLAWRFGHYSAVAGAPGGPPALGLLLPILAGCFAGLLVLVLGGILFHAFWTGDFMGFLPDAVRRAMERTRSIDAPAPGEGSNWALEFTPYLLDMASDPWIIGVIALVGVALILWIYRQEGQNASIFYKLLLGGMRACFLLLTLLILLPLLQVQVQRQGWPDVVLIFDDSQSMSTVDEFRSEEVKEAVEHLAKVAGLTDKQRLTLAQALVTRGERDWLKTLLSQRKKIHVYHFSTSAHKLKSVAEPTQMADAVASIQELRAEPANSSSQLGKAIRKVLKDFNAASLSAIVMFTDGVNTEGEDVLKAARYARESRVRLYFVGIGDSHAPRDLKLHDLQVEETVYVNDRVVFEVKLTGTGYGGQTFPVQLREKGKKEVLAEQKVTVNAQGKPEKVRLVYQPTEAGEKTFVIDVPLQPDEVDPDNNALERTILVREARVLKVLFVDGSARYDFRFVKFLLERETAQLKGNKSVDLKVLLLDADDGFANQDRSALTEFPLKADLFQFDVVILGDVDPKHPRWPKMSEHLQHLAEFVKEKGGGLLVVAGEQFMPHAYKDSPLKDVLPIEPLTAREGDDPPRVNGYRPELTAVGRLHPIFRFEADEKRNDAVWTGLREMFWFAEGFRPKPAAEILAVHPTLKSKAEERGSRLEENHPLVVQQFVGAGRCIFLGFNESWRWRWREDELRFNQFWIQTVRYLARSRLGRIDLRLDKQTPYRRGEPIKMTVRFPDDTPPPGPETEVKVYIERRPNRAPGARPVPGANVPVLEKQTVQLARMEGSRATYEGLLTRTPEGEYDFTLTSPPVTGTKPHAEAKVLLPPGEMEQLRMNQSDLERAAEETSGRFYTLADAERVLEDLPPGTRITLNAPGDPWLLWNHWFIFAAALALLTLEWVLRKRKSLL